MGSQMELYEPLTTPEVIFYGAAEESRARGRDLIKLVELAASKNHYLVVFHFPKFYSLGGHIKCIVEHGSVTLEGEFSPGGFFMDKPNKKRIQLSPVEPWGLSFDLPGPMLRSPVSVSGPSEQILHIVLKRNVSEDNVNAARASSSTAGAQVMDQQNLSS